MKRFLLGLTVMVAMVAASATPARAQTASALGTHTGDALTAADATSPLTVNETITSLGGGQYQYNLTFTNTDTNGIWNFYVYTPFSVTSASTNTSLIAIGGVDLNTVYNGYDARNINASLTTVVDYNTYPFETGGLGVGQTGTFSFVASTDSTAPLLYAYELDGNYADFGSGLVGSRGEMQAYGYTTTAAAVPEPASLTLLGIGAVGLLGYARRRRKAAMAV